MLRKWKKFWLLLREGNFALISQIIKQYLLRARYIPFLLFYYLLNLQKPTKVLILFPVTQGELVIAFTSFMSKYLTQDMIEGRERVVFLFTYDGRPQKYHKDHPESKGCNEFLLNKIKLFCHQAVKDAIFIDEMENPPLFWLYDGMCRGVYSFCANGACGGHFTNFVALKDNPLYPISFFTPEEEKEGEAILAEIFGGGGQELVCLHFC